MENRKALFILCFMLFPELTLNILHVHAEHTQFVFLTLEQYSVCFDNKIIMNERKQEKKNGTTEVKIWLSIFNLQIYVVLLLSL